MRTIHQGHLPVRTLVLIGMVILITAQAYAQNANARLTITLRNATLKEFVKLIENSTGYSFIYSEEISISHKINLKVKDMPLHEILDLVFKNEPISYKFSERYILLQKKRVQKPVSRKFTISGYVTDVVRDVDWSQYCRESSGTRNYYQSLRFLQYHITRRRSYTALLLFRLWGRHILIHPSKGYSTEYQHERQQPTARGGHHIE